MDPDIIGYIASFLIVVCYIPQIAKIVKTRNARDISIYMYSMLLIGQILYIIYGFMKLDLPIIVVNLVGSIMNASIIALSFYYQ